MQIAKAITGNLLSGILGRVVGSIGPLVVVPLMIRAWGMAVYGEWLIVTAIPAYIMMAPDFGLAGAVVNRMAFLTAQGDEQEAVYLYRSSWLVLLCAACTFVGIGWGVAWLVDWRIFGVKTLPHATATAVIGWSCMQIFVAQQGFLLSGIYRSAGQNPRWSLMVSIGSALSLAAGAAALTFGAMPLQCLLTQLATQFLWFCVLCRDSRRVMPAFTLSLHGVSFQRVRAYIVPGLGHAGMPLVNALQNQGVLLVLGVVLGSASVGAFQTMRVVVNGIKSILGQLSTAIAMEVPALLGQAKSQLIQRILVRNTQIGFLVVIPGILFMSAEGGRIFRWWLGPNAPYDAAVIAILLASLLPYVVGASFAVLLQAGNQIHFAILPLIGTALVSVAAVGLGGRIGGLTGAALGVVAWECCTAAMLAAITCSRFQHRFADYLSQWVDGRSFLRDVQNQVGRATRRLSAKPTNA
ncbi:lipopolysaccharide biosynthesis protein [Paludibaculum fermentans]|uniref:Polysaccharide biosynthesis protein n=1 Tax=Paludibaculum fermentans TaxID=1473598 RepID=A0A7S7NK31_PALFE|nr:hypothetical protein [Paludibaculum fermentans]QOY85098.1 hypothetical protein IRI77_19875 [Paludibaculum fermentans]